MCVCVCVCVCSVDTHVSDSVEIVCVLSLLPKNTRVKHFYKIGKGRKCRNPNAGRAVSLKFRVLLNNRGLPTTKSNYSVRSRRSLHLLDRWKC